MSEVFNWVLGQSDCRDGLDPRKDMPEAYYKGYAFEYELEQVKSELTKNVN